MRSHALRRRLSFLAALDAPVGGDATFDLDANLAAVRNARLNLDAGTGSVRIGGSNVPFLDLGLVASGTPDAFALQTRCA